MLFGSRTWKAYCGFEQEEVVERLSAAAQREGYAFSVSDAPPSRLYSSEPATTIEIQPPETIADSDSITITVITVRGDPIFRTINSLLGQSKYVEGTSLIQIDPMTPDTRPVIQPLLRNLAPDNSEELWDLSGNLQLYRSIYIRWVTKRRWRKILEING